jgi:hypothetical protein
LAVVERQQTKEIILNLARSLLLLVVDLVQVALQTQLAEQAVLVAVVVLMLAPLVQQLQGKEMLVALVLLAETVNAVVQAAVLARLVLPPKAQLAVLDFQLILLMPLPRQLVTQVIMLAAVAQVLGIEPLVQAV